MTERRCACGAEKSPDYAFCPRCYFALPNDLRRGLWSYRPGSYLVALHHLREIGRVAREAA